MGPTMTNGKRWKTATKEQVIKYLDPNNYMKEPYNYQFLDLSALAGISEADMKSFLNGKGILSGQEDVYLNAAQKYNISEVYLAAHSALETANGTSQLATGLNVKGVTSICNGYKLGNQSDTEY